MNPHATAADPVDVLIIGAANDPHVTSVMSALSADGATAASISLQDLLHADTAITPSKFTVAVDGTTHSVGNRTSVWLFRATAAHLNGAEQDEIRFAAEETYAALIGGLTAAHVRWVDDPSTQYKAEFKLYQLAVAQNLGIRTPDSAVLNDPQQAAAFAAHRSVVAKALSSGVGIAPHVERVDAELLARLGATPTLIQQEIDATADLRVIVIGDDVWAWRRPREPETTDWRQADPTGNGFSRIPTPDDIETSARRLTRTLGLTMSVQDWLETSAGVVILEANPQGAWAFLPDAIPTISQALAKHLRPEPTAEADGVWPKPRKRLWSDFMSASKAPANDGVIAPVLSEPGWLDTIAQPSDAIDLARQARLEAEASAATAEDKADRLLQMTLAVLTLTVAVGAFQLDYTLSRRWPWLFTLIPIAAAVGFLVLSAFEAAQVDRVGVYLRFDPKQLGGLSPDQALASVLWTEEVGRQLAGWTSRNKHTDLMQARAWFTRGLAAALSAAVLAFVLRAMPTQNSPDKPAQPPRATTTSHAEGTGARWSRRVEAHPAEHTSAPLATHEPTSSTNRAIA